LRARFSRNFYFNFDKPRHRHRLKPGWRHRLKPGWRHRFKPGWHRLKSGWHRLPGHRLSLKPRWHRIKSGFRLKPRFRRLQSVKPILHCHLWKSGCFWIIEQRWIQWWIQSATGLFERNHHRVLFILSFSIKEKLTF